jgi:hypothetical protein
MAGLPCQGAGMRLPPHSEKTEESTMYRLMQSRKFTLEYPAMRAMSGYRQRLVGQYDKLPMALDACEKANADRGNHHYVLNDAGHENYRGAWID